MKRTRFTEDQIVGILQEAEACAKTADLVRRRAWCLVRCCWLVLLLLPASLYSQFRLWRWHETMIWRGGTAEPSTFSSQNQEQVVRGISARSSWNERINERALMYKKYVILFIFCDGHRILTKNVT